jgi:hypothetical protein
MTGGGVVVGDGSEELDSNGPSRPAVRLPRFGVVASGALSLFLVSSVALIFPFGLLIAPLGLVPVVQQVVVGRPSVAAWGWVVALLAALAVGGMTLIGVHAGVYLAAFCLVIVLPAASIEVWRSWRWDEGRWAVVTTLIGSAACLGVVAFLAWPQSPVEALTEWWHQAAVMAEQAYQDMGVSSGRLELALDAAATVVPWSLPSVPVAYLVVVLFWIRPRLPMLGLALPIEPFERFQLEEWLPAGFAATGLGSLLLSGTPRWVAVNLLMAVLMLYFVQGLAIIRAHLARWVGRGWLVRWGVALFCVQGPLPLLVAALGIADGFYSLRPRTGDDGGEQ